MTSVLYKQARGQVPSRQANAGLVFNKFANGWDTGEWKFNPAGDWQWLPDPAKAVGDRQLLDEFCGRQREMVWNRGGRVLCFKSVSRFIAGTGLAHPSENGLAWHHTLGVPYLPGSSVKGILRSWMIEEEAAEQGVIQLFGSPGGIGGLAFFDLLPTKPVKLVVDVMTPHYGPYYQGKEAPGDWHSPVPIQFLTVEAGAEWQLGVLERAPGVLKSTSWDDLLERLETALEWGGAGAKTAVGYGRFERVTSREEFWRDALARARAERRREEARQAELAAMSGALAEIQRKADDEKWFRGDKPDGQTFLPGLEDYLAGRSHLESDVVAWLKSWFERKHKTLWSNPDETKKNKKPAHKPRWIDLVRKVKALSGG